MADVSFGRTGVIALVSLALVGCSSTRTLDGDPTNWSDTLRTGDRVTVVEASGQQVDIRFETIEDGVLYGAHIDDDGSAYAVPLDEVDTLSVADVGNRGTGKTMAVIGLIILGIELIDALRDIPPGWPAYE